MTILDDTRTRNGTGVVQTGSAASMPDVDGRPKRAPTVVDSSPSPEAVHVDEARRHALRFFWMWLIFSTVVSIGGNVIHAWMTAPEPHLKLLAAIAAAVTGNVRYRNCPNGFLSD